MANIGNGEKTSGLKRLPPMTKVAYVSASENGGGWCLACHEEADGVEPDARRYECDACGARAVFGAEECLLMGAISFCGEGDDTSEED